MSVPSQIDAWEGLGPDVDITDYTEARMASEQLPCRGNPCRLVSKKESLNEEDTPFNIWNSCAGSFSGG